jgi:hypothetical protein
MHLGLSILLIILAIWKGGWRNWQQYALTLAYVIICNLLYNVLCKDYLLWQYKADILPNKHFLVDLFYSFINLPAVTLLFLSHYPFSKKRTKQVRYIGLWVLGSFLIEYPFLKFERLQLQHGYQYWMDILFYTIMYSFIRLHFTRPLLTYGLSAIFIVFMIWHFQVPLK